MAKAENADKALGVIGQKIKVKEEIDRPFELEQLLQSGPKEILSGELNQSKGIDRTATNLHYTLNNNDFGLNVLCHLNLGRAYQLVNPINTETDNSLYPFNVSPDAKRYDFLETEKFKMNKKWLNYILNKIENAGSAVLIVENLFNVVTTGNVDKILPYSEQIQVAYNIFNKPNIKNKIAALVRGTNEQEILEKSGLDLMGQLGKELGIPVKNPNGYIEIKLSDRKKADTPVKIFDVSLKTNARVGILNLMKNFAKSNPGGDIYYTTDAKTNLIFEGITNAIDKNGKVVKKPCVFLSFGPMCEWDIKNYSKNNNEYAYNLNRFWHKVMLLNDNIKTFFNYYTFPQTLDTSDFVGAVGADKIGSVMSLVLNDITTKLQSSIESNVNSSRKLFTITLRALKNGSKEKLLNNIQKRETNEANPQDEKTNGNQI